MVALVMNGAAHASLDERVRDRQGPTCSRAAGHSDPSLPKLTTLIVQQMVSAYLEEKNLWIWWRIRRA